MKSITDLIVEGDIYEIQDAVTAALARSKPLAVLEEMIAGLGRVGDAFQKGDLFIADVLLAADTFKDAMHLVRPALGVERRSIRGKVVLGTVQGDIHDIGKNLVAIMLEGAGFEVIDLGIDVPPIKFVEAVQQHHPQLVAMSALISTTMGRMATTIDALTGAGLRGSVRILVGGAPVSARYAQLIGADAYAVDAVSAIEEAIRLLK